MFKFDFEIRGILMEVLFEILVVILYVLWRNVYEVISE